MPLFKFVTKIRRDVWRNKVLANGKRLQRAEAARAGVSADVWPEYAAELDAEIDYRTRKRDRLLTRLKETA